jgi:hypothetical protein
MEHQYLYMEANKENSNYLSYWLNILAHHAWHSALNKVKLDNTTCLIPLYLLFVLNRTTDNYLFASQLFVPNTTGDGPSTGSLIYKSRLHQNEPQISTSSHFNFRIQHVLVQTWMNCCHRNKSSQKQWFVPFWNNDWMSCGRS